MLNKSIQNLVNKFNLNRHVEGGYYSEYYRSNEKIEVVREDANQIRNSSTSIYFLLEGEDVSCWHKLSSDEIWYFHCGSPLNVYIINPLNNEIEEHTLGNPLENEIYMPSLVINSNQWFAASVKTKDSFSFVSCSVTPGFDFKDFKIANKDDLKDISTKNSDLITKFLKS